VYLTGVQLVPNTKDRILAGKLMHSWRHVEDIVSAFLPRKWEVGGVRKLNVILELEIPVVHDFVMNSDSCEVRRLGFDASAFLGLNETAQDSASLSMLENGIRIACSRNNVPDGPGVDAVRRTKEAGFRFQWSMRKLAKWNPSRSCRAEIVVTFCRGGTDVALRVTGRQGIASPDVPLTKGEYWPSVWFEYFESRWESSEFVVRNRTGEETLRREIAA